MISTNNQNSEEVVKLFELISQLSEQLGQNRLACHSLQQQADELKEQALHTVSGFALRRYNTDITKEQFEMECERMNAHLMTENQNLQYENRQLTSLMKEFESTVDIIMDKFRIQSYSTQQHELSLVRYYEELLEQSEESMEQNNLNLELNYSNLFQRLSELVVKALRSLEGESEDMEYKTRICQLEEENRTLRTLLGLALEDQPASPDKQDKLQLPKPRSFRRKDDHIPTIN
ncbi:hypothetical protein WALSEDRAFT_59657 [Wallemia mellicola CBS 633.66]|uniref:Uncharacterized protein n=1 Tax=Wallemia mellicola (strain ATCC MYA-4683 / CBS 633.66) TaxID=671144 RepID=I4YFY4_WALMC|nr:hypothetical protein WALSEDRAFT_59657 [Wallemia mellicola CBS 633.66]EIM22876.1 hypothetical protein WALSEDRAFT_59657 [Wallemia mellicola CBS 633.66]|eukprot:XP_006956925.1 hypothetical protein WALSEDRAFT_59657 [Wallemia mellicola CBS 633.66]